MTLLSHAGKGGKHKAIKQRRNVKSTVPDILTPKNSGKLYFQLLKIMLKVVTGADSGGDRKLVLLYRFLHPGSQPRFLEGLEKYLLSTVVLHRCLFCLMVTAGSWSADPQGWRQLLETNDSVSYTNSILMHPGMQFLLIDITLLCRRIHRLYRACLQSFDGRPRSSFPVVALITSRPWSPTVQFTLKLGAFPGWRASALLIPTKR